MPETNAGMKLTESFAMIRRRRCRAIISAIRSSQYFVVGRVSKEQVDDYASARAVSLAQAERWLASNLDYDPE